MPDWKEHLRSRLEGLRLSPAREAEIVDELSQHLDERYHELLTAGTSETDALRVALDELDEPEVIAQSMRSLRQTNVTPPIPAGGPPRFFLADLWQDLRYAARMLRKQPGFTVAATLTLALGIGANTAIFSLINATLLQTLPVAGRDRLVNVWRGSPGGVMPYPLYASLRDNNRVFDAYGVWGGITASLNDGGSTDLVPGAIVTGNLFDLLGVRPGLGRLLSVADDQIVGAHPVTVISHALWQTRFAARTDIVGREILLNGHRFTIVGVTPPEFRGFQVGARNDVYVPMMMQAIMRPPRAGYSGEMNPDLLKNPTNSWLSGIARLKTGVTPEQAGANLSPIEAAYASNVTRARTTGVAVLRIDDGNPVQRRALRAVALLLAGVVGSVLLIACANIANMLLARAAARQREIAVRLALGASAGRLLRQLLTESVLLSLVGGLLGVALAWALTYGVTGLLPPPGVLPLSLELAIDLRVLAFAFGLSVLTGIVFGVVPARRAVRPNMVPALKDAATTSDTARTRRWSLQKALVVAEVALSMLLLIPAGLFVRSLQAARAIDPGFDVEHIVSAPLSINLLRYTSDQGREFYRRVVERVEQLPGVESAGVARNALLGGSARILGFLVEGQPEPPQGFSFSEGGGITRARHQINANIVSAGFFETLGIPLVAGRDFGIQDTPKSPLIVIISETTARMHFGGTSPLGKRVSFRGRQGPWHEIVGVVRDSKYATIGEDAIAVAYLPVSQNHETGMVLYARTSVPPATLVPSIRREIRALEPNLPIPQIQTMKESVAASLFPARMGAWLIAVFGALALLLAAVGVYGVLSFSISRRIREMGIRLALGAEALGVFALVLRDGMRLVAAGLLLGLAGGLAVSRLLERFLYGVSTTDAATLAVSALVLLVVALVACVVPASRAMRVDPVTALRYE
jgi:macrolide transport system ATP-binding/permease protein